MHILAELSPLDPVAGSRVTIRASTAQDRSINTLNGVRWWPAIKPDVGPLRIALFDGNFTTDIEPGNIRLTLMVNHLAKMDPNVRRYLWAGASVTIYADATGTSWPWTTRMVGKVDSFQAEGNEVQLQISVDQEPFQRDVLTATYAGTTGLEGDADLKNKPKPMALGRLRNIEPVQIDAANSVFQFHAYGPVQAVNGLYERGSQFAASVGDYATYTALVAATIPAGRYATCLAQGLVRLGAPPAGVITVDVDGDKPSTWLSKTGEIISRVAINAGISAGQIDSASLTALDAAISTLTGGGGIIGVYVTEQETVLDFARRLARPCNATAGVSLLGKLFAVRVAIGTAQITLDAQCRQRPGVFESSELPVSPPYARIEMTANRSWRVHNYDEIAFYVEIIDRGEYSAATTYREGNIVYQPSDGNSYIYTSSTPSSGNGPPNAAYWSVFQSSSSENSAIFDALAYSDASQFSSAWRKQSGNGEISFVADATSPGGIALEIGNNSGNDMYWGVCRRSLPFSASDLYEISADIECITPGASTIYVGVAGLAADRATWVNVNGADSNASQHYFAANADAMAAGQRTVFRGYFQGKAASGNGTKKPDPSAPGTVHSDVAYVAPMFITGYNGVAARYRVHSIRLRKVEDIAGRYKGTWSNATAYVVGEEVSYLTRRFRAIAPSTNVAPPATATSDATWVFVMGETSAVVADGSNRVRFSDFDGGATFGWQPTGHGSTTLGTATSGINTLGFVYSITTTSPTAAGQFGGAVAKGAYRFPVTAGERLAVSAWTQWSGGAGSGSQLVILWYQNLTDAQLSETVIDGTTATPWTKLQGFVTVPAGAQFATVYARVTSTGAGTMQMRCGQPMVSTAFSDQVAFPPYAPGPVIGAPSGTFVGTTAAATVEGGAVAANNGVNSDGTIKTDKVATAAVQNNAITGSANAYTAGTIALTGSYQTIQTITITTTGGPVVLLMSFRATGSGSIRIMQWRLQRAGADLFSGIAGGAYSPESFTYSETPAAGTHTYTLQALVSSGSFSANSRSLVALELKK